MPDPAPQNGLRALSAQRLGRDIFAGAIAGLVTIAYSVSFSALIFSGPLSPGVGLGFTALLTGAAVTGLVIGVLTRLVPADAGPDTPAVAVMSVLAVSIATRLGADAADANAALQVLITLSLTTLLVGMFLYALGALKAGIWLRFIPYPVIGGFLAASGWFLISGGIEVMTGSDDLWQLIAQPDNTLLAERAWHLAAGLTLAVAILLARSLSASFLVLPACLILGIAATDLALWTTGAGAMPGWYLATNADGRLWMPVTALAAQQVNWAVIAASAPEIAAVCGVTAIALLLDISSLEVARGHALKLNHELKANGLANLVAAPLGGFAGNLSMSGSVLIAEAGAASRAATFASAGFAAMAIFLAPLILGVVPVPLLGGVLVFLGATILYKSLIESAPQRSLADNLLALAIALAIGIWGYLNGVFLGVVAACLTFAFSYSRISVIRQHLDRTNFASSFDRSPERMALLAEHGGRIQVIWLAGYIFFGTSNRLFDYAEKLLTRDKSDKERYLLLDFEQVSGLDSSAVFSLKKLQNACTENRTVLAVSGLSARNRGFLEGAGFLKPQASGAAPRHFADRDRALKWCEDDLLTKLGEDDGVAGGFAAWLGGQLGRGVDTEALIARMKQLKFKPGKTIVNQGTRSNSIDIVASGRVAISYRGKRGGNVTLRHVAGHSVIGEMGFYRKAHRTATVVAEQPTVIYRMDRKAFDALAQDEPELALSFHQFIVRLLADRLEFANREIAALLRPASDETGER